MRPAPHPTLPYVAIVGLALLVDAPALIYGFPAITYDAVFHANLCQDVARQVWSGEFDVRWLNEANAGLGSPVLYYYPPLSCLLTAVAAPAATSDPHGWHLLAMGAALALAASGAAAYAWLRTHLSRVAAFSGAALYVVAPYHGAVDLYLRGAYSEYWAFVWLPAVLYCTRRVASRPAIAGPAMALAYAALVATHPHTALMFSPVAVLYAALLPAGGSRRRALFATLVFLGLGGAMSAIYAVPAVKLIDYVHYPTIVWNPFDAGTWRFLFRFPDTSHAPTYQYVLDLAVVVSVAVLACALLALLGGRMPPDEEGRGARRELWFWGAVGLLALVMTTPLSAPVWQLIGILQTLQYPSRFAVLLSLAAAAAVANGLDLSLARKDRRLRLFLALQVPLFLVALAFTGWFAFFSTTAPREDANANVAEAMTNNEYWPVWAYRSRPEVRERILQESIWRGFGKPYVAKFGPHMPRTIAPRGVGDVGVLQWRPRHIVFGYAADSAASILVGQLYFPGWTAWLQDEPCCLEVGPSRPDGLVEVALPAGRHVVELRLRPGRTERLAGFVSLTALGFVVLAAWLLGRRGRARPVP